MYGYTVQYVCVIYLAALTSDDTDVSRDSVSTFNLHQIPNNQLVGVDLVFLTITDHDSLLFLRSGSKIRRRKRRKTRREKEMKRERDPTTEKPLVLNFYSMLTCFCTFYGLCETHLWHQILEAGNDVGTLEFLVVTKATSYDDNSNQSDGQVQLERDRRYNH